jgi:hypothetical protein
MPKTNTHLPLFPLLGRRIHLVIGEGVVLVLDGLEVVLVLVGVLHETRNVLAVDPLG